MTYSVDLREKIIAYIQKGGSVVDAAQLFGVGRREIHRWLAQLKAEGHINKKTYVRTKFKINREILQSDIDNNPDAYLKERAEIFKVSPSGIWRALQTIKITRKKKSGPIKNVMKPSGKLISN